jgi:membrane protease YdiL (CAAX protease family)
MPLPPNRFARLAGSDLLLVVILTLGAMKLLGPMVTGLLAGPPTPGGELQPSLTLSLGILVTQSLLTVVVLRTLIVQRRRVTWRELGLLPASGKWLRTSVMLGVFALPMVWVIGIFSKALLGEPAENTQIDFLMPQQPNLLAFLPSLFAVSLLVPLAEELAFRGLLYGWLRARLGRSTAIALSAVIFGLFHGQPDFLPAHIALGALLAYIYERSGSLWPAVVLHGVFNGAMLGLFYLALCTGALSTGTISVSP